MSSWLACHSVGSQPPRLIQLSRADALSAMLVAYHQRSPVSVYPSSSVFWLNLVSSSSAWRSSARVAFGSMSFSYQGLGEDVSQPYHTGCGILGECAECHLLLPPDHTTDRDVIDRERVTKLME